MSTYSVSVPEFEDLGVYRQDEVQGVVEHDLLDGQLILVVLHHERP